MRYMLDTNIVSYLIRERLPDAEDLLAGIDRGETGLSVCVKAELTFGALLEPEATKRNKRLEQFLRSIKILPWDEAACDHYADIAAKLEAIGEKIGHFDEMIAAHARSQGCVMITNNIRHFARIPGLSITNWPI